MEGWNMGEISEEYMKEMMLKTKNYTVVILKATEKIKSQGQKKSFGNMEEGILNCEKREFCQLFVQ
jgi:hypothetical protein